MALTVLIPTFRRNDLLIRSISSIYDSDLRPIHVIVSDNDRSLSIKTLVSSLDYVDGVTIEYELGPTERRQSANVNHLFDICKTDLCILMHDDDFFLPKAIDHMFDAWRAADGGVDAVFGRQLIVDANGKPLNGETLRNDRRYFKNRPDICQASRLASALLGQFPNNGMLMRTRIAKAVRYPGEHEVGSVPVDFHFSIRYAAEAERNYICIPEYTTAYRITPNSIIRSGRRVYDGHLGWKVLDNLCAESALERWALDIARDRFSGAAVMGYLWSDDIESAWAVLRDRFRSMDKPLAVRLALALLLLALKLGIKPQRVERAIERARAFSAHRI